MTAAAAPPAPIACHRHSRYFLASCAACRAVLRLRAVHAGLVGS